MVAVGMVGLGAMGGPMARRMLECGVPLTVVARREKVAEELARLGARRARSLEELATECDLVIVCVFSDDQLRDVALGSLIPVLPRGATLISHTTANPATVVELSEAARARGASVLDAPVSGDPSAIADGRLTIMVGGDEVDLERSREVFAAYSDHVIHVGEVGAAMAVKLVNNLLMAANLQLAVQAIEVGSALGANLEALAKVIPVSSGRSYAFDVAAQLGAIDALNRLAGPYLRKDVDVVHGVTSALGIDTGVLGDVVERGPLTYRADPV